ncbi:MAG: DUF4132 domain-containing protein [Chloroflexota bacterium]|nr:MAG: DUF4132 domain-containing protein [Chloroflexota bacterium]
METPGETFASRLAAIRERLDHPPGVILGVRRLPILEPLLGEIEAAFDTAGSEAPADPALIAEIERTAELMTERMLGDAPETVGPRGRLIELLRRSRGGELPALAFDDGDAFGAELGTMLETDRSLRLGLGRLHPLVLRATAVAPTPKWTAEAQRLLAATAESDIAGAIRRTLSSLIRADIVSRPDLLVGGLRLVNQRVARGLLWFASIALDSPAELIAAVGVRMGTSGRSDAVVRDTAVANTCAALLGASDDPGAAAALATMRVRVTNRNVLKQIDRALDVVATRTGVPVATVIELALPTFDLGPDGRLELPIDGTTAVIAVTPDATVRGAWRGADGIEQERPPAALATAHPAEVADIAERLAAIRAAVVEERRRMEDRLASSRTWPEALWRARYADHPIGRIFGRRMIWRVGRPGEVGLAGLPDGDGWVGANGRPFTAGAASEVRLWHPADAGEDEIAGWRATLAVASIEQPIRQADREVFQPLARDIDLMADRRYAGRIVSQARLRAMLRDRGWAVPALGAWDQGDEATAFRDFEDDLRVELRYQIVERVPTGERQERARLVAVRFVTPAGSVEADGAQSRRLTEVPPRVFSEAIRDVSLVAIVAEEAPRD